MLRIWSVLALAVFFSNPIVGAHDPPGALKNYCEDPSEWNVHDYGPVATGLVMLDGRVTLDFGGILLKDPLFNEGIPDGPVPEQRGALRPSNGFGDGNLFGDCNGDGIPADFDGHIEFAFGGGWLSAGDDRPDCNSEVAHHPRFGPITVVDVVNGAGQQAFAVASDFINLVPPTDPAAPNCGDFESDEVTECVGTCTVTFPEGLDGTYQVYVGAFDTGAVGTTGHICTPSCEPVPLPCTSGVDPDTVAVCDFGPACPTGVTSPPGPGQSAVVCGQAVPSAAIPTGVKSCSVYNTLYAPPRYPGQNTGVVIEHEPPGPPGDVPLCVGAVTGAPCQAGMPGVLVNNAATCAPNPCPQGVNTNTLAACGTGPFCASGVSNANLDTAAACGVGPLCASGLSNANPDTIAACGVGPLCASGVSNANTNTLAACGAGPVCPSGTTSPPGPSQLAVVCGQGVPNPCPGGAGSVNPTTLAACGAGPVCPSGVTSPPGHNQLAVVCGQPVPNPCPGGADSVDPTTVTACGAGPACPSGVTSPAAPGQLIVVCGQAVYACSLSGSGAGPGWTVGAQGVCVGLPWAQPGGANCPGALVNVRLSWGSTPGLPPNGTFDACF